MLLGSRTLLGGYMSMELYSILSSARVHFHFAWLLLKSHHPSTFYAISRQIRVYTTFDQKVLESFTANKPVRVE
ncbi:hypothetical protein T06_4150 [Trichinella sp. T6]|nr:hypothetical protein T06_4150 [Trichinella sp. T6]